MYFSSFFFFCILIQFSSQKYSLKPIPEGNGKLNSKYKHNSNENNIFFIFLNFKQGSRAPLYLTNNNTDILGGKWPRGEDELTNIVLIMIEQLILFNLIYWDYIVIYLILILIILILIIPIKQIIKMKN